MPSPSVNVAPAANIAPSMAPQTFKPIAGAVGFMGECIALASHELRCPNLGSIEPASLARATSVIGALAGEWCASFDSGLVQCAGRSYTPKRDPSACEWRTDPGMLASLGPEAPTDPERDCPKTDEGWWCAWKVPTCSKLSVIAGLSHVVELDANSAADRVCARTRSGQLYCWGNNVYEQSASLAACLRRAPPTDYFRGGDETTCRHPTAVVLPAVRDTALGDLQTCAATLSGTVYCWGALPDGYTQPSQRTLHAPPTLQRGWHDIVEVELTERTLYGRTKTGQLFAKTNNELPHEVTGFSDVSALAASMDSLCALDGAGRVRCRTDAGVTQELPELKHVRALSARLGWNFCALTAHGTIECWLNEQPEQHHELAMP